MLIPASLGGQTHCRRTGSQACPNRAAAATGSALGLSGTPHGHAPGPAWARWPRPPCHTQAGGPSGLCQHAVSSPGERQSWPRSPHGHLLSTLKCLVWPRPSHLLDLAVKQMLSPHTPGEKQSPEEVKETARAIAPSPEFPSPQRPSSPVQASPRPSALCPAGRHLRPWASSDPPSPGSLSPAGSRPAEQTAPGRAAGPLPPRPLLKLHSSEGLGSDGSWPTVLWLDY